MKTTLLTRLLASVVLTLGLTLVQAAPIPLEEVKVGSIVTSEGIGIGWGKYLPVPEGEWEVVVRDDMTYNSSKANENAPVYYIQLLNKNENSALQLVQINYANPRGQMSPEVTCNLTEGHLIADRINTLEGQNYQLCAEIFKPYGYKFYFDFRGTGNKIINLQRSERDYLKERFGFSNPKMIISRIETGKKGNLGLRYYFGFKMNTKNIDKNSLEIQKVHEWLVNNLNLLEKYYDNQKINFLTFNPDK